MASLISIIQKQRKQKLNEEEAPAEIGGDTTSALDTPVDGTTVDGTTDTTSALDTPVDGTTVDGTTDTTSALDTPVDGTETLNTENNPTNDSEELNADDTNKIIDASNLSPDEIDKTIEGMIGITNIQHTSSSSIVDFEDGGQVMYIQPMVSIKSETLNQIISLIIKDVKNVYSEAIDEITGKKLEKTKYWQSIETLVETMVRSQLTKSENIDGLIDEIKQVFKVLEIK